MPQSPENLILEVHSSDDHLTMCIGNRRIVADTVRQYTRCPVSRAHLAEMCRETLRLVSHGGGPAALQALRKNGLFLWDQLVTPDVKEVLQQSPAVYLFLVIDEELVPVPWELLYDGNEFLALKFNMGRLIRTRSRKPPPVRRIDGPLKMIVLADPTGDLRSAYKEGVSLRKRFGSYRGRVEVDFKSTAVDTLFVRRCLREYDIVHFAGHCEGGAVGAPPGGWVLSDGRLSAADVLAMTGGSPLPALVFSNACYSAQVVDGIQDDYGEKTYSMASAFVFSGVRHYLGTMDKIGDVPGSVFSAEFYHRFLGGCPVGDAVRRARLAVIRAQDEGDVSWAKYILYGDPAYAIPPVPPAVAGGRGVFAFRPGHAVKASAIVAAACLAAASLVVPVNRYYSLHSARMMLDRGKNAEAVRMSAALIQRKIPGAHLVMADALARFGRFDEAIQQCFDYILADGTEHPRDAADTYVKIGWLYQSSGEYAKAVEFYTRALTESRTRGDKQGESSALRKLAVWHMDKCDDNKALELLTKCLDIDRDREHLMGHRYNLACDYFDMGLVFRNKDELGTAKDFYRKSMQVFERLRLRHEKSDYYFNVGEILLLEKQYQLTLENYLRGLQLDLSVGDLTAVAADYEMIGELYAEMEQGDRAEEYFLKALRVVEGLQAKPVLASVCYDLGVLYKKNNAKARARPYLERARDLYHAMGVPDAAEAQKELEGME